MIPLLVSLHMRAAWLGERGKGMRTSESSDDFAEMRESWVCSLIRGITAKLSAYPHVRSMQRFLIIGLAVSIVAPVAHAIPLTVLEDQACQRGKLEVALKALPSLCQTEDASCKEKRQQITAVLRDYIEGIQSDIDFCKRYAQGAGADEQKDIMKAIKEYQADLQWAHQAQKTVARSTGE